MHRRIWKWNRSLSVSFPRYIKHLIFPQIFNIFHIFKIVENWELLVLFAMSPPWPNLFVILSSLSIICVNSLILLTIKYSKFSTVRYNLNQSSLINNKIWFRSKGVLENYGWDVLCVRLISPSFWIQNKCFQEFEACSWGDFERFSSEDWVVYAVHQFCQYFLQFFLHLRSIEVSFKSRWIRWI